MSFACSFCGLILYYESGRDSSSKSWPCLLQGIRKLAGCFPLLILWEQQNTLGILLRGMLRLQRTSQGIARECLSLFFFLTISRRERSKLLSPTQNWKFKSESCQSYQLFRYLVVLKLPESHEHKRMSFHQVHK